MIMKKHFNNKKEEFLKERLKNRELKFMLKHLKIGQMILLKRGKCSFQI